MEARLDVDDAELTRQCEQAIGNYDPCISCATHFLDLTIERSLSLPNGRWFQFQLLAAGGSWSSAWATSSGATTAQGPRSLAASATWHRPAWSSWSPTASPPGCWRPGPGRRWPSWSTRSAPSRLSRAGSIVSSWTGRSGPASSHGLGLDDAISLAVALDRMPGRLIVHAIEAADLSHGTGLTPAVAAAVGVVATAILDDIGASRP